MTKQNKTGIKKLLIHTKNLLTDTKSMALRIGNLVPEYRVECLYNNRLGKESATIYLPPKKENRSVKSFLLRFYTSRNINSNIIVQ